MLGAIFDPKNLITIEKKMGIEKINIKLTFAIC